MKTTKRCVLCLLALLFLLLLLPARVSALDMTGMGWPTISASTARDQYEAIIESFTDIDGNTYPLSGEAHKLYGIVDTGKAGKTSFSPVTFNATGGSSINDKGTRTKVEDTGATSDPAQLMLWKISDRESDKYYY